MADGSAESTSKLPLKSRRIAELREKLANEVKSLQSISGTIQKDINSIRQQERDPQKTRLLTPDPSSSMQPFLRPVRSLNNRDERDREREQERENLKNLPKAD